MKSQDGRCTAAYECKAFPYFTINCFRTDICTGNHGGILAFFERGEFLRKHRCMLNVLQVEVTSDCELLCKDEDTIDFLIALISLTFECEQSEWENPSETNSGLAPLWDILPFDFSFKGT
jgi:hypothetical protein